MPHFLPALVHPTALATAHLVAAAKPKTSGGSPVFFIFLIVIVGVYFLFIAPQRRKMRAQVNQQANYEPGDEVVTKGGIFGRVVAKEGDRVSLEIAEGTTIEVLMASIARRVDPVVAEEPEPEPDEDEYPAPRAEDLDEGEDEAGAGYGAEAASKESSGWTEPAHAGWTEPAHEAATVVRGEGASGGRA